MRIFTRLYNLLRGGMGGWLRRRERSNPAAVYEAAIEERLTQYGKLREAAAGVLYMRSKLAKDLEIKTAERNRLRQQLGVAVDGDDDTAAMALISRSDALNAEIERVNAELAEIHTEAEAAKKNLVTFQNDIARLREEKVRMLARFANAQARLRFHETLQGLSADADIRALESVREHINRLVTETQMSRELGDTDLEQRLGAIREKEATAAARAQLEELKRARRRRLLPVVLPVNATL
ncbi:MAG TPA: PspA/IM30 family protein [Candidatus Acidoferrales bacterium]|nr:PspA/IM30 family protein [Candidatus Acidoferrales bacterium]